METKIPLNIGDQNTSQYLPNIVDVGGRRPGVGDPKPGGRGKIFPIFFFAFSKFSTSAMFGHIGRKSVTGAG